MRRDASSKLSKSGRIGYFPAVAAAWKLKDQLFSNSTNLTDLKLRIGWGETGNQDGIDYYSYLNRYQTSGNSSAYYQLGNTFYSLSRPAALNDQLKWETTATTNLGLDFGFMNNRISGSIDIYQKDTRDLLSSVPTAPGSNFGLDIIANIGKMKTKGFEFAINTVPYRKNDLSWDLNFNYAAMKSEITKLRDYEDASFKGYNVGGINGATGNNIGVYRVGYAPFAFSVFKQVYDANGNAIEGLYEDLNRDGVIDSDDRYIFKKPAADITMGLSTGITYKKLNIGIAGHGAFGNYLYNNFNSNNNALSAIKDQNNVIRNAGVGYLTAPFGVKNFLSDYYIENASFFRIDNINLGYAFGNIISSKTNLRASLSIQNVATFTKYSGLDPENSNSAGVDYSIYPRPRTFTLGVSLDF